MQATATTTHQGRFTGASQFNRKNTSQGERSKQKRLRLIHAQPGTGASSLRNNQPPAIKIPLRSVTGIHVDLVSRVKGSCLLDDESKVLKALEDLYPIISSMDGFKDNTRWGKNTSVTEVFHVLLAKSTKLIEHEALRIALHKGVYRLQMKIPIYFDVEYPTMPVYWIAELDRVKKSNLFDLCFYLIRYLNSKSVGLWEEDNEAYIYGNMEENLAYYLNGDSSAVGDERKKEIEGYTLAVKEYGDNGEATKFYKKLIRTGCSKKIWLEEFEAYSPKTKMEKDIYKWLTIGKKLILMETSLDDYISLPAEYDGNEEQYDELPLTPDQCVKFLWRAADAFSYEFFSMCESQTSNAGAVPFLMDKIIEKPSDLTIKDCFPEVLMWLMAEGRQLEKDYRDVFSNPNKLKKALFKQARLIDILV